MFESCLFESRPDNNRPGRRKKPATLAMATMVHVLIAGALILIPLLQTHAVPPVALPPPVVSPSSAPRFIKLASSPSSNRAATRPRASTPTDTLIMPAAIPDKVAYVADVIEIGTLDNLLLGTATGPGGGVGSIGIPGISVPANLPDVAPPPRPPSVSPTPPPVPKLQVREPIRVSSTLQTSLLVNRVEPEYPRLAIIAGIEGTVVLEARITQTGSIDNLRIISGNPLFRQSVIDAVKQWRYRPTILSGEPIDVITTITVNFTLNRNQK